MNVVGERVFEAAAKIVARGFACAWPDDNIQTENRYDGDDNEALQ